MAETNPYPPGSARFKLWARREADRRKKEAAEAPPADISGGDDSKRRKAIDDAIEGRQSTDRANQ